MLFSMVDYTSLPETPHSLQVIMFQQSWNVSQTNAEFKVSEVMRAISILIGQQAQAGPHPSQRQIRTKVRNPPLKHSPARKPKTWQR